AMETLGLLAMLCALMAGAQTQNQKERFADCPVDLFFVLDTSESVALRKKPPKFYIDQVIHFTNNFIDELREFRHRCDRTLTWNSGALHYSDEVKLIRGLSDMRTDRKALKDDITRIDFIGKGTYTDCAIKEGLGQLLNGGTHYQENKYIVVVTDGHPITGYKEPCGGVQEAANEAKQHGVKVFAVAILPDQEETRLSLIATDQTYRQNFTAADDTRSTKMGTIRTIIEMIVCILLSSPLLSSPGETGRPGMPGEKGDVGKMVGDFHPRPPPPPPPTYKHTVSVFFCFQGLQGESGPKGDSGPYGLKGGKGDPGKDGEPGRPGNYGPLGPQGERGPRGNNGDKGERGDDGEPGPDGNRGERGQVGEKGEQGSRGNRGPRGDGGEPGPRGEQGREGSAGPNGDPVRHTHILDSHRSHSTTGPKGPRGIKGAPGDRGLIGERGEDGVAGNGTVGCLGFQVRGGKGTPGPKGDDGDAGDPGPDNNEPGPPGTKGAKGHRGPEGNPVRKPWMCACACECEILDIIMKLCCKLKTLNRNDCKCAALDLAFIVDSSESIGSTNFALAKDFIITVIDRLTKDQQLKVMSEKVRNMKWLAEATYTGEALDFALTNTLSMMTHENKVVIVLTDGRSDRSRDKVPINVLCGKGLLVGGLGVKDYSGREPNHEQLGELVCKSDAKPGFAFVLDNFAELLDDSFLQNLTSRICQNKTCPDYKCPLSFSESAEILVMMDSSASVGQKNFATTKTFVSRLAERFLTAERKRGATVKMGVGQYSRSSRMEQAPTTNLTLLTYHTEEAAFQNDGTNVLEAMEFAVKTLPGRGDASGDRRKLVLFSDGRSQDVTEALLEKRVREVADAGVEVFVIAVGSQVNEVNLRTLVSKGRRDDISYAQRHLFRVSDYNSLLHGVFHQTVSRRVSTNKL
uniref:Collagen type VI alpha 2 chain n=1 Tax=Cyclopterus lumpus TaxID=8103 RepID=A0A8C2ZPT8_CYCLU